MSTPRNTSKRPSASVWRPSADGLPPLLAPGATVTIIASRADGSTFVEGQAQNVMRYAEPDCYLVLFEGEALPVIRRLVPEPPFAADAASSASQPSRYLNFDDASLVRGMQLNMLRARAART